MNQKELEKIVSNWQETNLIENFEDKVSIALCLQSQLQFNENSKNRELTEDEVTFNAISIPLVVRVFSESKAFNRNRFVNYFESKRPEYLFLSTSIEDMPEDVNERAEFLAKLSKDVAEEIDEYFSDKFHSEITFQGFGRMVDGTLFLAYN